MEQIKRLYDDEESAQRERELNNARRRAVLQAWQRERTYVNDGKGTRDWTKEQQKEILSHGSVCGYEGHHMRSVSYGKTHEEKMQIAADKNNIQFLEKTKTNNEHLKAHGGDTRNPTNGYYDVKTGKMNNFGEREPQAPKTEKLSQPIKQEEKHYDKYGVEILNEDESHNIDRQIQNGYRR